MFESKILHVTIRRPKIHFVPDVVYAQPSTQHLKNILLQADLFIPQTTKKLPAVIFVTGGGFVGANRARMPRLRFHLAEKNFVVASINYRTAPNATFPQPIEDVKSAIRFFRANADKFSIDAEKIFVVGDSAGGYLSAFAAVTNGDRIVLTQAKGRNHHYALVSGFCETGESAEDTVRREVYEEVGLRVKNIRFYKSQQWPHSDSLLFGFWCELDGDDTITVQRSELSDAKWFRREEVEERDLSSLTAEMMYLFRNRKEKPSEDDR